MIHFSESDISELKALDIQEVLDYYGIEGKNNKYICPFHEDHDPSMLLNRQKNRCDCYVCNKRWDTIEFVRDMENKTFSEALITLVKISGGNIHRYLKNTEIKLPNIRRLKNEEKLLLNFDIGKEIVTNPMKPIKNWAMERSGDSLPNYNDNHNTNYYDGYLIMQRPKLSENYLYTHYPEVYRNLVLAKLAETIAKVKFLYEQGQDMSKEIAILNKLKVDFGYSNKKAT